MILIEIPLASIFSQSTIFSHEAMTTIDERKKNLALEKTKRLKTTGCCQTHRRPFQGLENCSIKNPVCQIIFINSRVEKQKK